MDTKLTGLESFLAKYPHITYIPPSSPNYPSLREAFCLDNTATPLAIVRPQRAEDVALILQYATSNGLEIVVRSGGHSLFGQSTDEGALTVDMRDIKYVQIDKESSTAKIGGGILFDELAKELAKEGLATPTGAIPTVGYVGWATYGGYGPFSANWGLGVDQIVGAKVVDSSGKIIEADDNMLKGIRGAGGILGIIAELTIKVYSLKTIFTGSIFYESSDIKSTYKKFSTGYQALLNEGIPPQLVLQQLACTTPFGKLFGVVLTWSSEDEELGNVWLKKIEALCTTVMVAVAKSPIPDWLNSMLAIVIPGIYGTTRTASFRQLSGTAVDIIAEGMAALPLDAGSMLTVHELRGPSATPNAGSVFASRESHFMLELIGGSSLKEKRDENAAWAIATWEDFQRVENSNLLSQSYISLTPPPVAPGENLLSKIYGTHDKLVLELKKKYDPLNVFKLAVPRLQEY